MLRDWGKLPQVYQVKVKGRLMPEDLERLGKETGARMRMIRQPDATRGLRRSRGGGGGNFWYEATLRDSKRDVLRRALFAGQHPVEELKRYGMWALMLEVRPAVRDPVVQA